MLTKLIALISLMYYFTEMMKALKDISAVYSGYPFRGKITANPKGSVIAVQMRDVNMESGINWNSTTKTNPPGRKPLVWLRDGDIPFIARGKKNYACVANGCPENGLLSPHFFQIRPDPGIILAEFLAWQLNQKTAQQYFARLAEGSAVVGIRKSILESTLLDVPTFQEQYRILKIIHCWNKQQNIIQEMVSNHLRLMEAISDRVLNKSLRKGGVSE